METSLISSKFKFNWVYRDTEERALLGPFCNCIFSYYIGRMESCLIRSVPMEAQIVAGYMYPELTTTISIFFVNFIFVLINIHPHIQLIKCKRVRLMS